MTPSTGQPKSELLGDAIADRVLPGRRRRRQDSGQQALRPGHGDAEPVPAAEQRAGRRARAYNFTIDHARAEQLLATRRS